MSPRNPPTRFLISSRKAPALFLLVTISAISSGFWCVLGCKNDPEVEFRSALVAKNPEEQVKRLRQAIAAAGGHYPEAEIQLCFAFARMKDWDKVGTTFAGLNQADCPPGDLVALAKLCLSGKRWKIAEEVLAALPEKGVSAEERLLLFYALYQGTDRIPALIDTTGQLTRVAPNNPQYWWMLAQIHERLENTTAAIRVFEAALLHDLPKADATEMQHQLLEHRIEVGDAPQARKQLDDWRAAGEQGPRMDFYDACIFQLEGHADQALSSLETVLRELGEIPEALRLRGTVHFELGHLPQAAADLKRVTELKPNDEIACYKLAEVYRRLAQGEHKQEFEKLARQFHARYLEVHKQQVGKQVPRPL